MDVLQLQLPPFKVLCDSTVAGPVWLVIAHRFHGSVNFFRNWTEYKNGFGDLTDEFFIGMDKLEAITGSQSHQLYIYLEDFDGNSRHAHYDNFAIGTEDAFYNLQKLGSYSGDAVIEWEHGGMEIALTGTKPVKIFELRNVSGPISNICVMLPPFEVLCDSTIAGQPGWMVIAHRFDGSVNFFRNWTTYKDGFGDLGGEFFIGLEKLHAITRIQPHELYVYLEDFDGQSRYAIFNDFAISSEKKLYELQKVGSYSGDAAGPGWLVVARRFDGSVNFFRNWTVYKDGFGDLNGEFFIGLDKLHAITASQPHELYVYLEDFDGNSRYANYDNFAISTEEKLYELQKLGSYSGDAVLMAVNVPVPEWVHGGIMSALKGQIDSRDLNLNGTESLFERQSGYPNSCPTWNGRFTIKAQYPNLPPFQVLCDATVAGPGWLVVAHRFDGSVNFFRKWTEYKNGFGDLSGEFFIGLDKLHAITASQPHQLYVYLEDFDGNSRYALYDDFAISTDDKFYELQKLGSYSGDAGDSLKYHLNRRFSTFDNSRDNKCSSDRMGAWWYRDCTDSNLFGMYLDGAIESRLNLKGITWYSWRGSKYSYKTMLMMVRPRYNA
ncbi:CG9500 [Drosophila busckii]|uniref:CG9500 n=1 Tax=Drosophila busckii TaxID=30019 RepID=A0A0M4EIK4_DROBS|nr:CG9500 [Drosophila busckii]